MPHCESNMGCPPQIYRHKLAKSSVDRAVSFSFSAGPKLGEQLTGFDKPGLSVCKKSRMNEDFGWG